jgi:hypothetical protein
MAGVRVSGSGAQSACGTRGLASRTVILIAPRSNRHCRRVAPPPACRQQTQTGGSRSFARSSVMNPAGGEAEEPRIAARGVTDKMHYNDEDEYKCVQ